MDSYALKTGNGLKIGKKALGNREE